MRRSIPLAILLLLVLLLTVSACTTGASAGPMFSEALWRDAEAYAEAQGISLDEAIERLRLQNPIGELNAVLEEREAYWLAGSEIESVDTE